MTSKQDILVRVLNSQSQAKLFHFKVMYLKVHGDTKSFSKCGLLFHFTFPLIQKKEREYLKSYDWDVDSEPVQRLWLSKDTTLMMEVINDFIGSVYKRVNIDSNGNMRSELQIEDNG